MPLACLVCLLLALPLLDTLIAGGTWWVPACVMAVAVAGVSALYRLGGWNTLPVPFLQLAAVAFLVTPLFAAGVAPLGVVPTGASAGHLATVFGQGVQTINGNAPPVPSTAGIMLVVAVVFAVFMMAADFLAATARCPGMVGGLLLALMAVPLLVDDAGLEWLPAAGCAVGFLFLLAVDMWVRGREWGARVPDGHDSSARALSAVRRVVTVSLASAGALALALTVPLALPSLRTDVFYAMADGSYIGRGEDSLTTTNPLVSLRRDLGASSEGTVLTYRTDAEEPDYLRTYVLDAFDGVDWTMSPVNASFDTRVDGELSPPAGWGSVPSQEVVTTRVSVDSDAPGTDFLPLPYWARTVEVSGEWYADPDTHMVFTTDEPTTGLSFTVETVDPEPSPRELAGAGEARSPRDEYLDLPDGMDPRVLELSQTLTEGARGPYERAVAIQEHFTGGAFTYDLDPPTAPEGADPLAHFLLEDRVGYCEQFAGAMAVMARQVDIPARVAVGYTAGENQGADRWKVTSGDAHAWPELYFEGVGWVRFEPTPASGGGQASASVPDYARGGAADTDGPRPTETPEAASPQESEHPEESQSPEEPAEEGSPEAEDPEDAPSASTTAPEGAAGPPTWLPAAAAPAALLLLLVLPALVRALVRWSRTAPLPSGAGAGRTARAAGNAHGAWRELRDTCLDLGGTWDLSQSPRAVAERLARSGPVDRPRPATGSAAGVRPEPVRARTAAALRRLALAEESARYAPSPASDEGLREDLRTVRAGLAATVGVGARVRAVLLPRSLAPWRRPRPTRGARPLPST